jgi:hypothetical protein
MLQFNEETGEWYEDGEGNQGSIPPEPPAPYSPELVSEPPSHVPTIKGYGTHIVMDKEPGKWTNSFGEAVSPDYVRDVDSTIAAVDSGLLSEGGLSNKIKRQENIPSQPSDQQLTVFERLNAFMQHVKPDIEQEATKRAEDAATQYRQQFSDPSGMPRLANQQKVIDEKAAEIHRTTFQHYNDRLTSMYQQFGEKQVTSEIDAEKRAANPTDTELITASLTQKIGRKPTAQEILTAKEDQQFKAIDVPSLAKAVSDGQDAPVAIKGSMGNPLAAKVKSEVLKDYPKFDFTMADANYKWKQSATNQRTVNFAAGALPRLQMLDEQLKALPNVNMNSINAVMRAVLTETGNPVYADFESNRNAIVQEINTALSGTSQSSDTRLNIELENLKSKRSPEQIAASIKNLREALIARLDVDLSNLYPLEVIRGEKTMEEYKTGMFQKFRGIKGKEKLVYDKLGLPYEERNVQPVGGKKKLTPGQALEELRRRGKL